MEEMLETPFYHQDDILSRSIPPSVLYNKNGLDLNLQSCPELSSQNKSQAQEASTADKNHGCMDSPNLDFLKLGSPDLERMFMHLQENVSTSPSDDSNAAFTFAAGDNLNSTENCFTDALQQLHDQQESGTPINSSPIASSQIVVTSNATKPQTSKVKAQHGTEEIRIISNNNNNNSAINNNSINQLRQTNNNNNDHNFSQSVVNCTQAQMVSRAAMNVGIPIVSNNGIVNINGHLMPKEQFIMNNMAVLGNNNNHHPLLPPQMQQEIAFLNHAMGFVPERDGMQQAMMDHVTMADTALQFRHMHPRFQDNSFIENNFADHAQMHVPGMDAVSVLGHLEEQNKMFIESNSHYQPIDLELQEMVKRERKKLRNRVASSKCRKRKLEREARLDQRVKDLKEKNIELGAVANALKQQVCDLKQRVMDHVNEGCQIVLTV
eukprot:gene17224-18945_t